MKGPQHWTIYRDGMGRWIVEHYYGDVDHFRDDHDYGAFDSHAKALTAVGEFASAGGCAA